MSKQHLKNILVDILATNTPNGYLINYLPTGLRKKARQNLRNRTKPITALPNGAVIYKTYSATAWKKLQTTKIESPNQWT